MRAARPAPTAPTPRPIAPSSSPEHRAPEARARDARPPARSPSRAHLGTTGPETPALRTGRSRRVFRSARMELVADGRTRGVARKGIVGMALGTALDDRNRLLAERLRKL